MPNTVFSQGIFICTRNWWRYISQLYLWLTCIMKYTVLWQISIDHFMSVSIVETSLLTLPQHGYLFDALAQASDIRIERGQVIFRCWMQDSNQGFQTPNRQQTECPLTTWISNHIHYKVWNWITYPFPNFNGATVDVWWWINNFTPHFAGYVIT